MKRGDTMNYEDEIYHSGYLDGYYDSMELYHADDEMTEEERKARRRKRRRNIALGVLGGGGVALGAAYAYNKAKEEKRIREFAKNFRAAKEKANNNLNKSGAETVSSTMRKSAPKPKRTISGFRRNKQYNFLRSPGTYTINPVTGDFGTYLTLHGMHIKARQKPYKK